MASQGYRKTFAVRFAGEGGQGLVTSAEAVAKSAATGGYYVHTFSTFPSQIMGGPASSQTTISTSPVLSNGDYVDVLVALNKDAYELHSADIDKNGVLLYDSTSFEINERASSLGLNAQKIAQDSGNPRAANMAFIGAVAELVGFSLEFIESYIAKRFSRGRANDEQIIASNITAIREGASQAKLSGFSAGRIAMPSPPKEEQIFITGNTALALGAYSAGLDIYVGYPISPATTILVWMEQNLVGKGKFSYQATSEIEAANAIIGAGFAGKKGMTATAGPGLSLMSEAIGLAWMAEIPCVFVDVQRGGPATGLPTKSEQSDLFACMHPSHGDLHPPVLAPGTIEECFYTGALAVNWAERYQGPVMLMSEFGQAEKAQNIPKPDISKIKDERRNVYSGQNGFKRYSSWSSGDPAPQMPIPGGTGAYVANASEHDEIGDTTHLPYHHVRLTQRRFAKLSLLDDAHWEIENPEAEVALMPWGSSKGPVREAYNRLRKEGIDIGWIYSVALNPLCAEVLDTLKTKRLVIVPELNYQGQWSTILRQQSIRAKSITQYTGLPFLPSTLTKSIKMQLNQLEKVGLPV